MSAKTRVVEEQQELTKKLDSLRVMLSSSKPSFISGEQWALMQKQEAAMGLYLDILSERLSMWDGD